MTNPFRREQYESTSDYILKVFINVFIPFSLIFYTSLLIYLLWSAISGHPVTNVDFIPPEVIIVP